MIGSGLAVIGHETFSTSDRWKANSLSVLGLLLILYSIAAFNDKTTRFTSLIALIPTIGTMLVLRFGDHTTAIGRFLSVKPLVGIGLISYSLYLWHQPLLAFARIERGDELTTSSALILIVVALLFAFVTSAFCQNTAAPLRQ
jgi:peptidoglycan/LPS O-acetylase OafA/YrhL